MQICNRPPSTRFPNHGVTRFCTLETLSLCSAFEKRLLSYCALDQLPIKLQILMSQLIFAIFCKYINHYLHLTYYYHFTLMVFLEEQCFGSIFNNFKRYEQKYLFSILDLFILINILIDICSSISNIDYSYGCCKIVVQ